MTALSDLRAIPTLDGTAAVLVKAPWRSRIRADQVADYVRLYRRLRDRDGGRFAAFYTQPVRALEALAKAMGIAVPVIPTKLVKK